MSCFPQAALEWDCEVGLGISRTGTKSRGGILGSVGTPALRKGRKGERWPGQEHRVTLSTGGVPQ